MQGRRWPGDCRKTQGRQCPSDWIDLRGEGALKEADEIGEEDEDDDDEGGGGDDEIGESGGIQFDRRGEGLLLERRLFG